MIKEVSDTKEEIEKYQLVKKIGNGSFGKVYLAVDERLHKRWAIKCIPRSVPNAELEGFLLNKLKHPGIPAIWDVFSGEKNWYLVMEYVEGQTLGEFLLERGRVRTGQVLAWGIELCDILIYLHERNPAVIHGDLKPENIIKNKDGKLVLIDFGAARELLPQNPENWMGTKEYQPPECQKGEFSEKMDIYMLGCVMRELWDGRHGWRLSRIIRRCMHANPGKRYANAKMLQKELAEEWKRQKEERRILPEALIGMGILILAAGTSLTEVPVGHPQRVTVIQESPQEKFAEVLKFYAAELYEEGILKEDAGLLRAGIRLFKQEQELNGRED